MTCDFLMNITALSVSPYSSGPYAICFVTSHSTSFHLIFPFLPHPSLWSVPTLLLFSYFFFSLSPSIPPSSLPPFRVRSLWYQSPCLLKIFSFFSGSRASNFTPTGFCSIAFITSKIHTDKVEKLQGRLMMHPHCQTLPSHIWHERGQADWNSLQFWSIILMICPELPLHSLIFSPPCCNGVY